MHFSLVRYTRPKAMPSKPNTELPYSLRLLPCFLTSLPYILLALEFTCKLFCLQTLFLVKLSAD